jgi:outer membrane receptor protein involved in Fe transport
VSLTPFLSRPSPARACAALLCTLAVLLGAAGVQAQTPSAPTQTPLPEGIRAQPLAEALDAFARQTSLQVVYVSAAVAGRRSREARAGLSPEQSLARLLEGSGLAFEFLNARTVRVFPAPRVTATAHPPELGVFAAPAAPPTLDEITVTATKREQPLSRVPISAYVLSQADMDAAGVKSMSDIAALTPGLSFDLSPQYGPGILTNIAIRGVAADIGAPTTGVYIDEVPVQAVQNVFRNAYPFTFDLARVEVLRGPQGTLFGASAQGGAVRFITNEPSLISASGLVHTEVDAIDHGGVGMEMGAAVGGPLVQGLLGARASFWYRNDPGYIDRFDPVTGAVADRNANRANERAARLALVYEPLDGLRIRPMFMMQSARLHDAPVFYLYRTPEGTLVSAYPHLGSGKLLAQPYHDSFTLGSLRVDADLGPVTLTLDSAYFDRIANAVVDETNAACIDFFGDCGSPLGPAYPTDPGQGVPTLLDQRQIVTSHELRLASSDTDARFTWLAGFFYSVSHVDGIHDTFSVLLPETPAIYSATYNSAREAALFGRARLALSRQWSLAAGTRVTYSGGASTDYEGGYTNAGAAPYSHAEGGLAAVRPAPRFDLEYQPDERNYFYLSASRGVRGGGGNGDPPCGSFTVPPHYISDSVWNYELGAKSAWFDRRLQLAASVFRIRWDDLQQHLHDACGDGYTTNAGSATSSGFDLSADVLTEHLRVRAAVGYLSARFNQTVVAGDGTVAVDAGTALGQLPSEPNPWNGNVSVEYRRSLGGLVAGASGYARAQELFSSRNPGPFTESDPRAANYIPGPLHADPGVGRLDLTLGLVRAGLDVRVAVDNVFNAQPQLHPEPDEIDSPLFYAYTLRPRTWVVALTQQF